MKRKGLILLVLTALVAGGAFAQKVGDAANVSGKNYTIQEVKSDGSLVLKPIPEGLDGVWQTTSNSPLPSGSEYNFSGTTAVLLSKRTTMSNWNLAIEKGYWKVGEPVIRNIKSTEAGKWSCELLWLTYEKNTLIGADWTEGKIEALPDGRIRVSIKGQQCSLKRK
jgi:hypothetical protein